MSSFNQKDNSIVSVRYERDSNGVLMQVTEDGIRTHIKFIYDESSVVVNLDDDGDDDGDDVRFLTPRAQSPCVDGTCMPPPVFPFARRARCGSTSSQSSGVAGINHWARQAPFQPNAFANAPPSDLETEIVPENELHVPAPASPPARAMSDVSGTTQPPDSVGRAGPESAYYPYQQSGTRKYYFTNPKLALKAEGNKIAQRCDALNRNLSASNIPNNVHFEITSTDGDQRFASPCPSAQVAPPSLFSREGTPVDARRGLSEVDTGTEKPVFDFVHWKWYSPDLQGDHSDGSSTATSSSAGCQHTGREPSPSADVSHSEIVIEKDSGTTVYVNQQGPLRVSGFLDREDSPLTEYDYSEMDRDEHAQPRPIRKVRQLPTPEKSPSRRYTRTEPIITRRRAKLQMANLFA